MVLLYLLCPKHFFSEGKIPAYPKDHLIAKFSRIKPTVLAKKTDL